MPCLAPLRVCFVILVTTAKSRKIPPPVSLARLASLLRAVARSSVRTVPLAVILYSLVLKCVTRARKARFQIPLVCKIAMIASLVLLLPLPVCRLATPVLLATLRTRQEVSSAKLVLLALLCCQLRRSQRPAPLARLDIHRSLTVRSIAMLVLSARTAGQMAPPSASFATVAITPPMPVLPASAYNANLVSLLLCLAWPFATTVRLAKASMSAVRLLAQPVSQASFPPLLARRSARIAPKGNTLWVPMNALIVLRADMLILKVCVPAPRARKASIRP